MAAEPGRTLFRNLIEYPLLARPGVKDYIFHLVLPRDPPGKFGYDWASRRFFDTFYKTHERREARSLEGVISSLHAEVTHGIQHIREIIIVAHANSQAMLFPILDAPQANAQHGLTYVNELTLARLRKLFVDQDPQLQSFKTKRDAVLPHLTLESWVTIRGCNFGNSSRGMYATCAFFGGRADVYAPRYFMHFGEYGIDPAFARLNSKVKFHDHLVRQHFLPADRTPERKKLEVEQVYEPALFSAPHTLASVPTSSPTPQETAEFNAIVTALNSRTLTPPLVSVLAQMMSSLSIPSWTPTPAAKLTVTKANVAWTLTDTLAHESDAYSIAYKIDVGNDAGNKIIRAQAQLSVFGPRKFSEGPLVMLQLFLTPDEDDVIRGRLHRFAGFADTDKTPDRKDRLAAVLKLLKLNKLADPSVSDVDLKRELLDRIGLDLAHPQLTTITPPSAQWPEQDVDFRRAEWALQDGQSRFSIKLENPATPTGDQGYTVTLYASASPQELYIRELDYLADHVGNADTPGTELAAYFDRLTIDELLSVIEFLRDPFKPGHSLYIAHAQQAMTRKRGFLDWLLNKYPELVQPYGSPLVRDDEWEMSASEKQDKDDTSYPFNFTDTWLEVRNMYPAHIQFQNDLFLEEDFAAFYNIKVSQPTPDLQTDSPTIERQAPTAFESQFSAQVSVTDDKQLFDEEEDPTAGCKEFEAVIDTAMQVKDLPADDIEKLVEEQKTAGGTSYFELIKSVASKYSFVRRMANWTELIPAKAWDPPKMLPWVPSSTDGLVTEAIKRILDAQLKEELAWWVAGEGVIAANTTLLQSGLALLWTWGVVMVPGKMLLRIAEAEADSDEKWEAIGYLTAARQWLRRAADLTYNAHGLPDLHSIRVDTPVSTFDSRYPFATAPYYVGRYYLEQVEDWGTYATPIWSPDALKRGFDHGVWKMPLAVADELKRRAEHGVDELLKRWGFDSCKIRVLINAGILDIGSMVAAAISVLASKVLEKVPHV